MENQEQATSVAQAEALALVEVQAFCAALEEAREENLRDKIKQWPQRANNASSIGHPCERYLYYLRVEGDKRPPHGPGLQAIFDLGNYLEQHILDEITKAARRIGYHFIGQQKTFFDERAQLSARIDGAIVRTDRRGDAKPIPTEVKTCSPFVFDKIRSVQDILHSDAIYMRSYYDQLQSYLYTFSEPLGIIVLFNKSTGQLRFIPVELDFAYYETVLQKCERVNTAVAAKTPPDRRIDFDVCTECAFKGLCFDGATLQAPTINSERMLQALAEKEAHAAAHRLYEKAGEVVKEECARAGHEIFEVGPYLVKRTLISKKASEATTYWKNSIKLKGELK